MSHRYPPKFYIETYGCQANEADSEKAEVKLLSLGLEKSDSPGSCDIFIINSCSVRQKSEDKVYGLGKALKFFDKKPFVVLMGCMVGSVTGDRVRYERKDLERRTPWVDLYLSSSDLDLLPSLLQKAGVFRLSGQEISNSDKSASRMVQTLVSLDHPLKGFVNISSGCDNFCSYCVVPYSRGKEVSRPKVEIINEIEKLMGKGVTSVTLCGQNVNSWGLTKEQKRKVRIGSETTLPFAALLREVHDIAGIKQVSFLSSNPFDFTNDLVDAIKSPKVDNYLHIAVQSGNNDILRRMNRRHTVEEFLDLIRRIQMVKPNLRLGTDIIVGFPGETREQFMDTVKLFYQIKFRVTFISIYSPRKGTMADKMYQDDVSREEKRYRHKFLTKVWRESIKE